MRNERASRSAEHSTAPFLANFGQIVIRKSFRRLLLLTLFWGLLGFTFSSTAQDAEVPAQPTRTIGYAGQSFSESGLLNATGEKPERKLWWNNCAWWSAMFNQETRAYHIYRLNWDEQEWEDTGTQVDERNETHADTLWDEVNGKLYILSHIVTTTPYSARPGNEGRLYRFSYDSRLDRYNLDTGFPVDAMAVEPRVLTFAQDSTGRLWMTYVWDGKVQVQYTMGDDRVWSAPEPLPVDGATVGRNDISAVVAFDDKIGVAWTNHRAGAIQFAVRDDDDDIDDWDEEIVIAGELNIDDHLNITADAEGRVYLATKTSNNRVSDPFILINVREGEDDWTTHVFGYQGNAHTRGVVVVDEENEELYVFATSPQAGGTIYYKSTPLDNISFEEGLGTPILHFPDAMLNNVTVSKQRVNGMTDLVIMASAENTARYYHNFLPIESSEGDDTEAVCVAGTSDIDAGDVIYYVSSPNRINVRTEPTTTAPIYATLEPDSLVVYLGEVEGELTQGSSRWAQIELDGQIVYVHSGLLSPNP